MKQLILIGFLLVFASNARPTQAQEQSIPPKNSRILVKIPKGHLGDPKVHIWNAHTSYSLVVSRASDGTILVNDHKSWRNAGWPLMIDLRLADVKSSKSKTEIQLKTDARFEIYLNFAMSPEFIPDAFKQVAFIGSLDEFRRSSDYQDIADRLLPNVFGGKLASLTRDQQLRIIEAADYDSNAAQGQEYKGKLYLPITFTSYTVYNTLQLGQSARVARVTQDDLLRLIKEKYRLVRGIQGIDGLQIKTAIGYKSFVDKYALTEYDHVLIYAKLEDIQKFDEADITSQQLLNSSVVLVNGDRVEVPLSLAK